MRGRPRILAKEQQEAEDPNTTASRLESLHESVRSHYLAYESTKTEQARGFAVMEAIASHPNTPLRVLTELIVHYARAFCRNPVSPLLLLEQPNFAADLPENAQLALLMEPNAPPNMVRSLAQSAAASETVREAARLHVCFSGEAASGEWEAFMSAYWAHCCACAEKNERHVHIDLAEIGLVPLWAKGPEPVPGPVFPDLKAHGILDGWFGCDFAPHTTQEARFLRYMGPIADQEMLARALRPAATPIDMLRFLKTPENSGDNNVVHAALLRHPAADGKVIAQIANKNFDAPNPETLEWILRHPKTPAHVLRWFLQNGSPSWRRRARAHPNAPLDAAAISRRAVLSGSAYKIGYEGTGTVPGEFRLFVECLYAETKRFFPPHFRPHWADAPLWQTRLSAAFLVCPSGVQTLWRDVQKRTERDLLIQLSGDANRIVRAVAQTRLADPDYVFTW